MKSAFRKGIGILTAAVVMLTSAMFPAMAADQVEDVTTVLMMSGKAEVGKTISLSVKVSGEGPYGGFNGSVSVDSSYLEITDIRAGNYASSNFSKGANTFLDYNCNIVSDSTIVVIDAKCLKEGSSVVSVSLEVSSLDGLVSYSTGASANVNVGAPVQLSDNCNLSALSVSPGTLSPAFSKDTLNYTATVNDSATSIAVTATAEDSKAKVSLNGVQNNLQPGENTVKITVTAENGDTKTYKIVVTRGTPTPTPMPYPLIQSNGSTYTILDKGTLSNIPSGFTWSETTYSGSAVPCLVGPDGTLLMWLLSDNGNHLYVYDLESQSVKPCYSYETSSASYMFIPFPKNFSCPQGYALSTYVKDDIEAEAYRNALDAQQPLLVYMLSSDGHEGLYYLDEGTGLVMPYKGSLDALIAEPTPEITEEPTPVPDTPTPVPTATSVPVVTAVASASTGVSHVYKSATIALAVLSAILFIVIIVLLVIRRYEKNQMLNEMFEAEEAEEAEEEQEESEEQTEEDASEDPEPEAEEADNHKDFYYQFGDEPQAPVKPEPVKKHEEPEKKDLILDFPEFPEQKEKNDDIDEEPK